MNAYDELDTMKLSILTFILTSCIFASWIGLFYRYFPSAYDTLDWTLVRS